MPLIYIFCLIHFDVLHGSNPNGPILKHPLCGPDVSGRNEKAEKRDKIAAAVSSIRKPFFSSREKHPGTCIMILWGHLDSTHWKCVIAYIEERTLLILKRYILQRLSLVLPIGIKNMGPPHGWYVPRSLTCCVTRDLRAFDVCSTQCKTFDSQYLCSTLLMTWLSHSVSKCDE